MALLKNTLYSVSKGFYMSSIMQGEFESFVLLDDCGNVEFHLEDGRSTTINISDDAIEALEGLVDQGRYRKAYDDISDEEFEAMLTS